jgi:hypothetical protein
LSGEQCPSHWTQGLFFWEYLVSLCRVLDKWLELRGSNAGSPTQKSKTYYTRKRKRKRKREGTGRLSSGTSISTYTGPFQQRQNATGRAQMALGPSASTHSIFFGRETC